MNELPSATGYRTRLRFRSAKSLATAEAELTTMIDGRVVTIRSDKRDQPLNETKWFTLSARGFPDQETARSFGTRTRSIVQLASLCSHWGIDVGTDRPTSWIDESFARQMALIEPHERIAPNIHGLMIFPDDDLTRVPHSDVSLTVNANVEQLLNAIEELTIQPKLDDYAAHLGVDLLNNAFMQSEPIVRIILAFSAVEALGQSENWSTAQIEMLEQAARSVEKTGAGTEAERGEVSNALRRSIHRIGLRQGVIRVLNNLGLSDRKKEWDDLYRLRSGVVHGTMKLDPTELGDLAHKSVKLAAEVVFKSLELSGLKIPEVARIHFSF